MSLCYWAIKNGPLINLIEIPSLFTTSRAQQSLWFNSPGFFLSSVSADVASFEIVARVCVIWPRLCAVLLSYTHVCISSLLSPLALPHISNILAIITLSYSLFCLHLSRLRKIAVIGGAEKRFINTGTKTSVCIDAVWMDSPCWYLSRVMGVTLKLLKKGRSAAHAVGTLIAVLSVRVCLWNV